LMKETRGRKSRETVLLIHVALLCLSKTETRIIEKGKSEIKFIFSMDLITTYVKG
jgi:hypothetical protein